MLYFFNVNFSKKGVSSVVAVSLLVITTVMSIVFFQNYMFNYVSSLTVNAETQDTTILTTGIDSLVGNVLYFKNEYSDLSVLNVKAGNISCNVTEGFFSSGLEEIDLGICLNDLEEERIHIFTVISDKGVFEKSIFVDNIVFVPPCGGFFCTALSSSLSDETPSSGSDVVFYANYTSLDFPVSGIGLSRYEIGQFIWKSEDLDSSNLTYTLTSADLDNDNERDEIIVGAYDNLIAYYSNGTKIWNNSVDVYNTIREIQVGDFDSDGYEDDIAFIDESRYIKVFNRTGSEIWRSSSVGDLYTLIVGDFDNQGIDNDFAVHQYHGIDATRRIWTFNTTNGDSWDNWWTETLDSSTAAGGGYVLDSYDVNNDGYDDILSGSNSQDLIFLHNGSNGSIIWSGSECGNGIYEAYFVDLDNDGKKDETILSSFECIKAFNETGGEIWTKILDAQLGSQFEFAFFDYDSDSFYDEFITIADRWSEPRASYFFAFEQDGNTIYQSLTGDNDEQSLSSEVADVTGDGLDEIMLTSSHGNFYIMDSELTYFKQYKISNMGIGRTSGMSMATDIVDFNDDSVSEVAMASKDGYIHIFQTVDCEISFDDSTSYNMTWNNSILKWQFNRSFESSGTYEYDITCQKNLYETQTQNYDIVVS